MGIINWLARRASKVYQWFGGSYYTWVSRLKSFFSYLRQYRDQAVKWAREYALPKIVSYWQDAKNRISTAYNNAVNWVNKVGSDIRIWAEPKILKIKNLLGIETSERVAEDAYNRMRTQKGDERVEARVKTWAELLFSRLLSPFKWILALRDFLQGLKDLFSEENLTKLTTLFNTLFPAILALAIKPLETLISIIQPVLLAWLNFTLAYALGTEKYDLPDWPDWFEYGGGGNGGRPPPGVKQDLSSPLSSLRISGYTYKNPPGHFGIDLALSRGQSVYTMHSGTVEYVNRALTGYGFQVTVRGGSWWTRYAHLEKISVKPGQTISRGQKIGNGDSTGASTGNHLHLEIKFKGSFINPAHVLF